MRGRATEPGRWGAQRDRRRSDVALAVACGLFAVAAGLLLHARLGRPGAQRRAEVAAEAVRRFGLTDLSLFTEARYTRHPTQADRFAPFGEHPGAIEHFPSGSIVEPPR